MIRHTISLVAAAGFFVASMSGPAGAALPEKMINKITPGEIASIMRHEGYVAKIEKDNENDPMISGKIDNVKFSVLFYNCAKTGPLAQRYCSDAEFVAAYTVDRAPPLTKLNEWNSGQAFGIAYLFKDGGVGLKMPVDLAGTLSNSFMLSSLEWWRSILGEFDKHMWPN